MLDSNRPWRDSAPDGETGGVLGRTLVNAAVLVGACLLAAWVFTGSWPAKEQVEPAANPAAPAPAAPPAPAAGTAAATELAVAAGAGGHFLVEAMVQGVPVRFLIDTGATGVVLTAEDAARLGFAPGTLDFRASIATANGKVAAAPVSLRELRLGQLRVYDLPALVTQAPMPVSLLGMSFLKRLAGYEARADRLILRW